MDFFSAFNFPTMTTAQRDAAVADGRLPITTIIKNISTNPAKLQLRTDASTWINIGEQASGTFTAMPFIAPPSDNDTSRQAYLLSLHAGMIANGIMESAPSYTISGVITGDILAGVSIELRDNATNTLITSVTSDVSGNYAFPAQPTGTYKVIPSLAGYVFNPFRVVQNLVADVTLNFASVQFASVPHASPNYFLVPQPSATERLRVVNRITKAVEPTPASFSVFTNDIATPAYANGRWFIADKTTSVRVFDESWTLVQTIVFPNPVRRVVKAGNKFLAANHTPFVQTNSVQFFTYDFNTDAATLGQILAGCGVGDMVSNEVKVYGTNLNDVLSIIDIAAETITNLSGNAYGSGLALSETHIYSSSNGQHLVRANLDGTGHTTLLNTPNSFSISVGVTFAYVQGQLWYQKGIGTKLHRYDIANNQFYEYTSVGWAGGIITDGTEIYCPDQVNSCVHIFDAVTGAQDPFPNNRITGSFTTPSFPTF